MPQVANTDDSTHSLIDVDSPHVSSVPSDFDQQSVKTETQAARLEREAEAKRILEDMSAKAPRRGSRSKGSRAAKMTESPEAVYKLANTVIGTLAAAVVGWGAYQKHVRGELTWKVVGLWSGVLAAFGAGDYFLGQYIVKQSRK